MKSTIWYAIGLVLIMMSMMSIACSAIVENGAATWNTLGILEFIGGAGCWYIGNRSL